MHAPRPPATVRALTDRLVGAPLRRLLAWLRTVPIDDPVDRRNAPMLQLLLVVIGTVVPVLAALRWQRDWGIGIDVTRELLAMLTMAFAWTCLYLVRVGQFRVAASLLIASSLGLLGVTYATEGLRIQVDVQYLHALPLILGGLLLGRRALWGVAAVLLLVFALGAARDLAMMLDIPALRSAAYAALLRASVGTLIVALILDRAVSALREALLSATRRGEELARTRDRLEREIVEKERSQAQLLHSQKMEAVGRLAGGVAHDFNNILGVILGYASRADAALDPDAADASLAGIRSAAQRGAVVTRRLLSLSRDEAREVAVFDAAAAVRDIAPMLRQLFGQQVQMAAHVAAEPLPVRLDRAEFELALLNIAANARDAMPDGGTVRINVERQHGSVAITVTDSGVGMPPDVIERMFDPFFTTKARGHGTGIGLAVVHRLATEAGGAVRVDSEPGRGTALRLLLPLVDAPPAVTTRPATLRVLLVEDDAELRGLLRDALRAAGCDVLAAGRVREAQALARDAERIDAVVSDFDLPDGTADELFADLAPRLPEAHLLLISALDRSAARRHSRGLRVRTLAKPFAPDRLVRMLLEMAQAGPRRDG
ncbi:ATP-binding protein [Chiayiivirga flava]|uniref:histidine kinase n=1 Tax=Chiayiivirga flava TaxID=659595 RepID=A0A7W8D3T6_9GAMM|nr:ATP-binding protein [Chiayiivirga flava]MBB5207433.1 signal transduction histidine kinase/CheY-like chemotaxis protein [Chiayiivirga flava]